MISTKVIFVTTLALINIGFVHAPRASAASFNHCKALLTKKAMKEPFFVRASSLHNFVLDAIEKQFEKPSDPLEEFKLGGLFEPVNIWLQEKSRTHDYHELGDLAAQLQRRGNPYYSTLRLALTFNIFRHFDLLPENGAPTDAQRRALIDYARTGNLDGLQTFQIHFNVSDQSYVQTYVFFPKFDASLRDLSRIQLLSPEPISLAEHNALRETFMRGVPLSDHFSFVDHTKHSPLDAFAKEVWSFGGRSPTPRLELGSSEAFRAHRAELSNNVYRASRFFAALQNEFSGNPREWELAQALLFKMTHEFPFSQLYLVDYSEEMDRFSTLATLSETHLRDVAFTLPLKFDPIASGNYTLFEPYSRDELLAILGVIRSTAIKIYHGKPGPEPHGS